MRSPPDAGPDPAVEPSGRLHLHPSGVAAMIRNLWNHAIKVEDLDAATGFYVETLGAELRIRGAVLGCDYRLLRLGGARVILFTRAPYEHLLPEPLPAGFLHAVYEVDDLDVHVERLRASGCARS